MSVYMSGDIKFFAYDEILKADGHALVLRHRSTVFKIYAIDDLLWIRELNFISYINTLLIKHNLVHHFKRINVVRTKNVYFVTKPSYTYDNRQIITHSALREYCVFEMKYHSSNIGSKKPTMSQMYKIVPELLFLMGILNKSSVIHRDIKEANFLLNITLLNRVGVTVIDFDHTSLNGIVNNNFSTNMYRGPELKEQTPHDERSDVWSFGVMVVRMLCPPVPIMMMERGKLLATFTDAHDKDAPYYDFFERLLNYTFLDYESRPTFAELCTLFGSARHAEIIGTIELRPKKIEIESAEQLAPFAKIQRLTTNFNVLVFCARVISYLHGVMWGDIDDRHCLAIYVLIYVLYDNRMMGWHDRIDAAKKELGLDDSTELLADIRALIEVCGRNVLGIII